MYGCIRLYASRVNVPRGYHRHIMFNFKLQRKYFDYATFDIEDVRFSLLINRTLKSDSVLDT